ncbi:hypothetical protein MKD49_12120 [Herbaspirillum sp. WGmk3]|uniref:hypothetical protein n=1 Tax=Herbaspirillum sp. WGmk3 TaxID=2919925 RepID=UPI002091D26F|nr:hypothetical protein [Herbaspirillum sp. WGmk3]MCO4857225.1 hypothetical protein [Herbaspirillum sp. WGmk3]
MLLYLHHTAGDVIELSPRTYLWHYAETSRGGTDTSIMGFVVEPIRGSYTEVDGKRYYLYWTADRILKFVTPENKEYKLFRYLKKALFEDLRDGLHMELVTTEKKDGSAVPGYSTFRLLNSRDEILHEVSYHAQFFVDLYLGDFTASVDRDLGTWDFFVGLMRGVEEIASKCVENPELIGPDLDRIRAPTGATCPRTGFWLVADLFDDKKRIEEGKPMPTSLGRDVVWEWLSVDIVPSEFFL